jgi:hypothetical protein
MGGEQVVATTKKTSHLTPAARRAIDSMLDARRQEIIERAERHASGPIDEIDVLRAFGAVEDRAAPLVPDLDGRLDRVDRELARLRSVGLITMSTVALVMVVLAVTLLPEFFGPIGTAVSSVFVGVFAIFALLPMLVSVLMTFQRRRRPARYQQYIRVGSEWRSVDLATSVDPDIAESDEAAIARYSVIAEWMHIEQRLREVAALALGGAYAEKAPIRQIVESLVHDRWLSEEGEFRVKRLLLTRNEVAHRERPLIDWSRFKRDAQVLEEELVLARRRASTERHPRSQTEDI